MQDPADPDDPRMHAIHDRERGSSRDPRATTIQAAFERFFLAKAAFRSAKFRMTVGTLIGLLAAGKSREDIMRLYPNLEPADFDEALAYAAWRSKEVELPLNQ